jgi:hypothetical protein
MVRSATLEISKYRNNPNANIKCTLKHIIGMSSVTLTEISLMLANLQADLILRNLTVNLSFQLLLYELTVGRGSSFLNSIVKLIETRQAICTQQSSTD